MTNPPQLPINSQQRPWRLALQTAGALATIRPRAPSQWMESAAQVSLSALQEAHPPAPRRAPAALWLTLCGTADGLWSEPRRPFGIAGRADAEIADGVRSALARGDVAEAALHSARLAGHEADEPCGLHLDLRLTEGTDPVRLIAHACAVENEARTVMRPVFDALMAFAAGALLRAVLASILRRAALEAALSDAQRRVLPDLLAGLTEREIAARIHRSPHTIHDHVKAIYSAWGVASRTALHGLIESTGPMPPGLRMPRLLDPSAAELPPAPETIVAREPINSLRR